MPRKFKVGDIARVIRYAGPDKCRVKIGSKVKIVNVLGNAFGSVKYPYVAVWKKIQENFNARELEHI